MQLVAYLSIAWKFIANPTAFWAVWNFIKSPIGIALITILAFFGTYTYGKHVGYANCKTEWTAANAAADLAKKELEAKVARTVRELAKKAEASLEQQKTEFEKRISDYEAELAKRPNNTCLLNDADIRRLRPVR
jgi:hypothetical protein